MDHLPRRQQRDRLHLLSLECCLTRKVLIRNAFLSPTGINTATPAGRTLTDWRSSLALCGG